MIFWKWFLKFSILKFFCYIIRILLLLLNFLRLKEKSERKEKYYYRKEVMEQAAKK